MSTNTFEKHRTRQDGDAPTREPYRFQNKIFGKSKWRIGNRPIKAIDLVRML